MARFLIATGARRKELYSLKVGSVNWLNGEIEIPMDGAKGKKFRRTLIYDDTTLLKELKDFIDERDVKCKRKHNQPLFKTPRGTMISSKSTSYNKVIKRAQIKIVKDKIINDKPIGVFKLAITPHSLRRTFATKLSWILTLKELACLMGHTSADTTEKYYVNVSE